MWRSGFLLLSTTIGLLGCGEEARISADAHLSEPLSSQMLTVTVRDGDRTWVWEPTDFRTTTERPVPSTPFRETRTSGDLNIDFRLDAPGETLSQGTVTLPLRSDWGWHVTITSSNEYLECFGCFGVQAFPLAETYRRPGRDSIWVVWGGNSISDPAIY